MTTQTLEARITALEGDARQGARDLSMMSQAMAEVLEWADVAERNGAVDNGTLKKARSLVRVGHFRTEIATLETTLRKMGDDDTIPTLRKIIKTRIAEVRSKIEKINGEGI
jgi:flavin-binding protein dodecin